MSEPLQPNTVPCYSQLHRAGNEKPATSAETVIGKQGAPARCSVLPLVASRLGNFSMTVDDFLVRRGLANQLADNLDCLLVASVVFKPAGRLDAEEREHENGDDEDQLEGDGEAPGKACREVLGRAVVCGK